MDNNSQSSNSTPPQSGIKKWQINAIIVLLSVLIIVLLIVLYFIIFKKNQNSNTVPSVSSKSTSNSYNSKKSTNLKTVSNPYNGWLSYQNSTFGYSIKYPSNWNINTTQANAPQQPAPVFASNESKILLKNPGPNTNTVTFIINGTIDFSSLAGGYLSKTQPITILGKTYYLAYINSSVNCTITPQTPINQLPSSCGNNFTQIFLSNTLPTISSIESAPYPQYSYATLTLNGKTSVIMDSLSSEQSTNTADSNSNIQSFINIVKSLQI